MTEAPLSGASSRRGSRLPLLDRESFLGPVMILPAVLYVLALVGFPFVLSLYLAVSDAKIASTEHHYVGLENFRIALDTPTFRKSLGNTLIFTLVSQALVLGKILATCLQQEFHGKSVLRFLILLPWVAAISLGTIGWKWMLDSLYSPVNWVLQALHIVGKGTWPMWFGEKDLAMAAVIGVHVWRLLPFATVIILAGLTSIPREVQEASEVDGAGFWSRVFYIVLPLLRPILTVAGLFGIIFAFTDMTVIYVLTRGGPAQATQVLSSLAFFTGILGGDLAGGAAISLFLFPVLLIVAIVMLLIARRTEVRDVVAGGARKIASRVAVYGTAISFAALLAFPFYWMLLATFKTDRDLYDLKNNPLVFNDHLTLANLELLFNQTLYVTWLWNTFVVGVAVVAITLALALPAGYALARLTGRWGEPLGIGIFLTYLVPSTLLFIPMSRIVATLGWQDSRWSLVLVYPSFTIPFCVWLLMGFFKSVPKEIEEAAMVDGCSRARAIVQVIMPISLPGILSAVIFAFTLTIQEFVYALTFITSSGVQTVSVGAPTNLVRGDVFFWGSLMAACLITSVPVAILYNLFLDRFIAGFTVGAIK